MLLYSVSRTWTAQNAAVPITTHDYENAIAFVGWVWSGGAGVVRSQELKREQTAQGHPSFPGAGAGAAATAHCGIGPGGSVVALPAPSPPSLQPYSHVPQSLCWAVLSLFLFPV